MTLPFHAANPSQGLSAADLGGALGVDEDEVRLRERDRKLFSVLRERRSREPEYPAFQSWEGIAGQPLANVLKCFGHASSTAVYGFFTSTTDLLGGLTPIEVMLGRLTFSRSLDISAYQLLRAAHADRLGAVSKAAEALAAKFDA